ncbi:MAG TPA: zinc-ribbon domain-containing protein [Pyrinomonadaceae bacterium]|jgi:predicted Zn finger-like uncharacterized protein|nr:zinc-ribbon domain-containing protein [Pyrinomonadaceae bacterium]
MIVTCPNCTARLQLEAGKVPARPFTVRCPKCQFMINAQPPASDNEGSALAGTGDLPASSRTHRELKSNAPATLSRQQDTPPDSYGNAAASPVAPASAPASNGESELVRLLTSLLQRGAGEGETVKVGSSAGRKWTRRRALACTAMPHRDLLGRVLARNQYEVFVVEEGAQAIEQMRGDWMDVIILDPEFDTVEQGAAHVTREIEAMRPSQRRRVFLVHLSKDARTGDKQAAFLNHVNLVVNTADLEDIPRLLERNLRDFNELYKDFNKALSLTDI